MSGAFPTDVRAAIWTRDAGLCVVCQRGLNSESVFSLQHRRARGMGGSHDAATRTAANGLLMCGDGVRGCHGQVEANPVWAEKYGFRVRQGQDPALIPVWHARFGWVLLNTDGTYTPVESPLAVEDPAPWPAA